MSLPFNWGSKWNLYSKIGSKRVSKQELSKILSKFFPNSAWHMAPYFPDKRNDVIRNNVFVYLKIVCERNFRFVYQFLQKLCHHFCMKWEFQFAKSAWKSVIEIQEEITNYQNWDYDISFCLHLILAISLAKKGVKIQICFALIFPPKYFIIRDKQIP